MTAAQRLEVVDVMGRVAILLRRQNGRPSIALRGCVPGRLRLDEERVARSMSPSSGEHSKAPTTWSAPQ